MRHTILGLLRSVAVPIAIVGSGCQGDPDIGSVNVILAAASPIAWAATLAYGVTSGEAVPCVSEAAPPVYSFEVDPVACPLALGDAPAGEAVVTVADYSTGSLSFAAAFGDLSLDGSDPVLVDVAVATVAQDTDGLLVAWVDGDLSVATEDVEVEQGTWAVTVGLADTPADPADDTLEIVGSRQWVAAGDSTASVVQTALALVTTTPSCRRNPISGGAVIEAANGDPGRAGVDLGSVTFHDDCDGNASFTGAGTAGFAAGAEVALDLGTGG